uniref:InaF motif containing 2 n=1 Tax=Sinocyclocheilus anshuiensis TaxID=1608454 RepID=A0A671N385_9TELE
MRGDKPVSTGRTNGGAERRPSYPGDQRVRHANRATKIWVKVAMGIAYFLCVSIAAFFLAIYYVLFWTPDGHNNATKTNGSCLRVYSLTLATVSFRFIYLFGKGPYTIFNINVTALYQI